MLGCKFMSNFLRNCLSTMNKGSSLFISLTILAVAFLTTILVVMKWYVLLAYFTFLNH